MMETAVNFNVSLFLLVIIAVILTCGVFFVVRSMASRQREERRRSSYTGSLIALLIVLCVALVGLPALYWIRSRDASYERYGARQEAVRIQEEHAAEMARLEESDSDDRPVVVTRVERKDALTGDITSRPVLGIEQVLQPRGDLEAWRQGDALAPREPAKPWVLDAAGSQSRTTRLLGWTIHGRWPGPAGSVVGYSGFDEPDSESALHTARHSARHHLKAMLLLEVRDFLETLKTPRAREVLRSALGNFEPMLSDYVLKNEQDRLVQQRDSSVGRRFYRAAVLVDASQGKLEPFAREFRNRIQETLEQDTTRRHELLLTVASALGLALVVFLLYSFLNAGTKGHFAWPLRIVSIGTLIVLYLGLMFLQGWFPL